MQLAQAQAQFIYALKEPHLMRRRLTPQEQRFLDLHQANIPDKKIAELFGISPQAIYNLKYSCKDKGYFNK